MSLVRRISWAAGLGTRDFKYFLSGPIRPGCWISLGCAACGG